jgi:hypothetical protein
MPYPALTSRTGDESGFGLMFTGISFPASIVRCRALVFLVILAVGSICARQASGQDQRSDDRQITVHGQVVNAVTQEPIGRALVYSPDNRFATLTDNDGDFELMMPNPVTGSGNVGTFYYGGQHGSRWFPPGALWLRARKPGFLDILNNGGPVQSSADGSVKIPLLPEALIKGRVSLSESDAAVGIEVQIFSRQVQDGIPLWVAGPTARTNSSGEFRLAELRSGTYKLFTHELLDDDPVATAPGGQLYGLPPVYYPGATNFAAAGAIRLAAGQTFQADLSPVRQLYYPINIPTLAGDLSAGFNINVLAQGHPGPGYSLGYNTEKQAIEGLLPSGSYLVEASAYGPNSATGVVNITVAGAPLEGPKLVLTRNGSIPVVVTEEFTSSYGQGSSTWSDGKRTFSLRGPRLYLSIGVEPASDFATPNSASIRPPAGPDDDSLALDGLAPGRYWLVVSSSRGYVASATRSGVDLLHKPLDFVPGSSAPIEITMRDDGAEIEGTVSDAAPLSAMMNSAGYPMRTTSPAYVYCVPLPDSAGQFQQLWVSPDGKFHSQNVAPGAYRVLAFKTPQNDLPYRDPEAMHAYDTKGQIVTLGPGQKENLKLQTISTSE